MHNITAKEGINGTSMPHSIEVHSMTDSSNELSGDEPLEAEFNIIPRTADEAETQADVEYGQHQSGGRLSTSIPMEEKEDPIENKEYFFIKELFTYTDNHRFIWFSRFRLLLIAIIIIPIFIVRLNLLSDISNITTTTSLESITEIEVPYIVFRASSNKTLPVFYGITFVNSDGNTDKEILYSDITLYPAFYLSVDTDNESLYTRDEEDNIVLFSYDEFPNDHWSRIYISPFEEFVGANYTTTDEEIIDYINNGVFDVITEILVPPKSLMMDVMSVIEVEIISYSGIINRSNSSFDDDTTDYIRSMANGLNHGMLYFADHTQQLTKYGSNAIEEVLSKFTNSSSFFALPGQHTYVRMEEFEVIDDTIDEDDHKHYSLSTGVSYFNLENAEIDLGCGALCNKPPLLINLYFVPHPAHIKYVIRKHYIFDVYYVFASVGGILAPLLTVTAILLVWLTWGLDFGCNCRYRRVSGVAPLAGFDDVFKRKLDAYLVEQGLIVKEK